MPIEVYIVIDAYLGLALSIAVYFNLLIHWCPFSSIMLLMPILVCFVIHMSIYVS